nr:unnamed protein product [Callosobruchus chinensis]
MSGRPLTDEELEELANQISSDSEADDDIEVENVWDSDDSIADSDFIPDDNDVEEAFENELMNVWNETNVPQTSRNETLSPKLGQAGLAVIYSHNYTLESQIIQVFAERTRMFDISDSDEEVLVLAAMLEAQEQEQKAKKEKKL